MYIYGIQLFNSFTPDEAIAQQAMEELGRLPGKQGVPESMKVFAAEAYESYSAYRETYPERSETIFTKWVNNYEDDTGYYHGFAPFLADYIRNATGIEIACDSMAGGTGMAVGIAEGLPWSPNERTKKLTKEEFIKVMNEYTKKFSKGGFRVDYQRCMG